MKDKEKTDLEKVRELFDAVNVPFSEYKDTYNKMCNAKELVVKMDEDSQEATIVENAILRMATKKELKADLALELVSGAITAFLSDYGFLQKIIYKDKKGTVQICRFLIQFSI